MERPIIFSGPMVQAILNDRKTQTRRIAKFAAYPRQNDWADAVCRLPDDTWVAWWGIKPLDGWQAETERRYSGNGTRCPYGNPSDLLWIRETWAYVDGMVWYAADGIDKPRQDGVKLRPSIYMPRWASRITLEIAAIKVERVREISQTDAMAEGVEIPAHKQGTVRLPHGGAPVLRTCHVSEFANLWDSINAKRGYGWDVNPWAWVIEFRRI